VGGQHHAPAVLPPGKTRYPLYRRLGGPQGRSGRVRKISPSPGFDPRTVQPVTSRYTDWATRPTVNQVVCWNCVIFTCAYWQFPWNGVQCSALTLYWLSVWYCHPVPNFSRGAGGGVQELIRNRYTFVPYERYRHMVYQSFSAFQISTLNPPQPACTMICDVVLQYSFIPLSLIRRNVWPFPP
jgi:hypothetical protein